MADLSISQKLRNALLKPLVRTWGRYVDQETFYSKTTPPQTNPDTTSEDEYFDISYIPYMIAGREARDISHLFVSARGLTPEDNNAASPPQLIYTTPNIGDQEVLDALAYQYDEGFEGNFGQIIRNLETPAFNQGRCIAENEWYRRENDPYKGLIFARWVWSRDPEQYVFDYDGVPGIYKDTGYGKYERMNDLQFMSYAYDPLYNNPYGKSILFPLKNMAKTWIKVYGYWRHALEKAGMGSWLGKYGPDMAGETQQAQDKREEFLSKLGDLAGGTRGIVPASTEVKAIKLQMEAQAFLDFHQAFVQAVSLLYTGSATALSEGKYGSYSKEESTTIREKAAREHMDSMRVSAFWTYEFNRRFCDINFAPNRLKLYPTLQLISPELIFPTTPEGQDTESVPEEHQVQQRPGGKERQAQKETEESNELQEMMSELQEGEPEEDSRTPAIPYSYKSFPDPEPEPEEYKSVLELATEILTNEIEAKPYKETDHEEAYKTFTIKRLRNIASTELLQELKEAIIPTLAEPTEADAWMEYFKDARQILPKYGLKMTSMLRDDLIVSFRQARQNAFSRALLRASRNDPDVIAMRLQTREDSDVRYIHKAWNDVVLAKDDPLLDELQTPMDFGCRCNWLPVRSREASQWPITPVSDLPGVKPGATYKYYAY
jgi:hypothetical protein